MSELPNGWHYEHSGEEHTVIFAPNKRGMVTIDYKKRGYRSGHNTSGPLLNEKQYAGRGWIESLESDAVAWLQAVLE